MALTKKQLLARWAALPANQPVNPTVIRYKHKGSTYAEDSIRVTGSQEFIESVMSRLKDLLAFEADNTRLGISFSESHDRTTGQALGSYNFYVQVRERGGQAKMVNKFVRGLRGLNNLNARMGKTKVVA